MRALVINCTLKRTPERKLSETASWILESTLADLGVTPDIAYPSDFWSPIEPSLSVPPPVLRGGLPANWLIEALLRSRILAVLVCPGEAVSWRVTIEALRRVGAVLDLGRAAGAKVGAPLSLEEGPGQNSDLLALSCRLLDAGYLVPEQAWQTWGDYGFEERSQKAANDLVAIAKALGAAVAGEGITAYPPPPNRRLPATPG